MDESFLVRTGTDAPVAAAAIHDAHDLRPEVAEAILLGDPERLREEDPHTAKWTDIVDTRLIGLRSRFEVDLNRPRALAVYRIPEDAWGLQVWRGRPSEEMVKRSLAQYDDFYAAARLALSNLREQWGRFAVLDIHTYNHRRNGPGSAPADPGKNPEVNIGTSNMNRELWDPVVERLMHDLRTADFLGRTLDVRENVKFRGGYFSHWIHDNFPDSGCSISIEFKKFFMDEWSGEADTLQVDAIGGVLADVLPGLTSSLRRVQ